MKPLLVDSNVLLDIATEDPAWLEWSAGTLAREAEHSVLVINPLIYSEVSVGFRRVEDLESALPADRFRRESLPWEAAFQAGKAFRAYRKRGGERRSPLPDFYIGAHAAVAGHRLMTRDAARYRTYFPTVEVIAPDRKSNQ